MLIRFYEVTSNTVNGVYRKEDFINPETGLFWRVTDEDRPSSLVFEGEYNFDATDNISELVIEINEVHTPLPPPFYSRIHRITHIVAETNQVGMDYRTIRYVAYSVDSVEFMGYKQVKFLLVEDPVISHMEQLVDSNMLITRTNDSSKFMSHDIADLAYTRHRNIDSDSPRDLTGKWVLTTYNYKFNKEDSNDTLFIFLKKLDYNAYEKFDSLASVIAKYPVVLTDYPTTVYYYGKYVTVTTNNHIYQCQYNTASKTLTWQLVPENPFGDEPLKFFINIKKFYSTLASQGKIDESLDGIINTKLTDGDLLTFNLAFPICDNIVAYGASAFKRVAGSSNNEVEYQHGWVRIPSYERIDRVVFSPQWALQTTPDNSVNLEPYIISKRYITGLALGDDGTTSSHSKPSNVIALKPNSNAVKGIMNNYNFWDAVIGEFRPTLASVPVVYSMQTTHRIKFGTNITSLLDYEPFKNWYINVFGNNIKLKGKFKGKTLYVRSNVSSRNWSVNVYLDNENNTIFLGEINSNIPYSIDKFEEFLSQNSTYYSSKWVNTILGGGSRVGKSAITGLLSGNVGAGALSIGTGVASLGQDIVNMSLQERAMRDAPDSIKGDGSGFSNIEIAPFGIYIYNMQVTSDVSPLMKTELDANGFPTSFVGKINNLAWSQNDIYGPCKLVKGRLVGMMHNYHITNLLNNTLEKGIVILKP